MKRLILIIYVALVVVLAVATFVEQARGTAFIGEVVYGSVWFCALWGVLAVLTLVACLRMHLWRRVPLLLLHGSFLVILGGAFLTFVWGEQGYIHLEEGKATDRFVVRDSGELLPLPFSLRLDSFRVQCYPGTDAPEDYISYVRLTGTDGMEQAATVSMNRILTHRGYRFYQSSYDPDGRGSWLSVNHDPWGIGVTYAGYALLGLSMLGVLFSRGGEFRRLLRHPLLRKGGFLTVLLLVGAMTVQAQGRKLPVLKQRQADSLAAVQVIYHDRVVPFNTLARDFVLKLTGRPTYKGLSPERVVGGWLLHPEVWKDEPMIRIKSADLRRRLGVEGDYARLSDLFDGQTYRLQEYWDASKGQTGPMSSLEKAIVETDEKVGLILMLQNGTLIKPLPADGSVALLPEAKVRAELLYNRIPFSQLLFMFNLTMGLLAFGLLLYKGTRRTMPAGRTFRWVERGLTCALWAALLFHAFGYALRWYIGGRIPLSNGYETMQFLALATLLLSVLFRRRFPFTLPFGFLLSGFEFVDSGHFVENKTAVFRLCGENPVNLSLLDNRISRLSHSGIEKYFYTVGFHQESAHRGRYPFLQSQAVEQLLSGIGEGFCSLPACAVFYPRDFDVSYLPGLEGRRIRSCFFLRLSCSNEQEQKGEDKAGCLHNEDVLERFFMVAGRLAVRQR